MAPKTKTKASEIKSLIKDPEGFLNASSQDDVASIYQRLSDAYYNGSKPLVSDEIFDIVRAHIEKRYPKHPILKNVGSAVPDDDKRKATLPVWMGSLDKVKNDPKQLLTFKKKYGGFYTVSDKLDGISALFVVEGSERRLYTRGDGHVGQNISHLLPFINGVPKEISLDALVVRGELIMSRTAFEKYGKGANARNTVSGLVNAKTPDLALAKSVGFVAYTLIDPVAEKPSAGLAMLKRLNFTVVPHKILNSDTLTFELLSEKLVERRSVSDYEIDGLVVQHDEVHKEPDGKNPDTAFAFKHLLTAATAEVVVDRIVWSLSKDGLIKPVVEFPAVRLSGVSIKKATGFNADFIKSGGIGPGAHLLITRSGDVIPYIMQVLKPAPSGTELLPTSDYKFTWQGKDIKVTGSSSEQDFRTLENFFDKIEVKGMRGATVKKLFDSGINSVRLFMELDQAELEAVPGFANKWPLVQEAKDAIRSAPCIKLMQASNAFGMGFGERKLKAITKELGIKGLLKTSPTVDELCAIEGIAPLTAGKFIEGLEAFKRFIKDSGLEVNDCSKEVSKGTPKASPKAAKGSPKSPPKSPKASSSTTFANQVVVFTGFRNKDYAQKIEDLGGEVGASVTKKTTILVAKELDKGSGKLDAARAKGIRVIDEQELVAMF